MIPRQGGHRLYLSVPTASGVGPVMMRPASYPRSHHRSGGDQRTDDDMSDKGPHRSPLIATATRDADPQGHRRPLSLSKATFSSMTGSIPSLQDTLWPGNYIPRCRRAGCEKGYIGRRFDGPDMWFQGPPQPFSPTTLRPASPWDRGSQSPRVSLAFSLRLPIGPPGEGGGCWLGWVACYWPML